MLMIDGQFYGPTAEGQIKNALISWEKKTNIVLSEFFNKIGLPKLIEINAYTIFDNEIKFTCRSGEKVNLLSPHMMYARCDVESSMGTKRYLVMKPDGALVEMP